MLVVPNKGYTSLAYVNKNCKRIKEMCQSYKPENIHILYYGDRDPSGNQMFEYIKQRFKDLGVSSRVKPKWVAITEGQIQKYHLPKLPINWNDPRAKTFPGKYAVELDAMIAYKPKEFEKLVQKSVDDLYDKKIYDAMVKEYETEPDDLEEIQDDIQDKVHDALKQLQSDLDE